MMCEFKSDPIPPTEALAMAEADLGNLKAHTALDAAIELLSRCVAELKARPAPTR